MSKKKSKKLRRLFSAWLEALKATHRPTTLATWENYISAHWLPFFEDADSITRKRCAAYLRERLTKVRAASVKKERTAFRSFCKWALENDDLGVPDWAEDRPNDPTLAEQWAKDVVNTLVPRLPERAEGVPYRQRRRVGSFEVSPEQIQAFLAALPEWSECARVPRFPIRSRFIVAYETSLRPSTLDRLVAPKHYRMGADRLQLSGDTDKAKFARDTPLTKLAQTVLDALLTELGGEAYSGLIFGKHDYRKHVRAAADKAMPPDLAARFAGAHLRSARITHLLERPKASMPGVQLLAGHKQVSTTARYVKPSFRAAKDTLGEDAA